MIKRLGGFDMTNADIKQVLLDHNVHHLYHTNTVETSLSFLKNGGLLSRGLCEEMGLPQTPQITDDTDRRDGIYFDIFFDASEIQSRTGFSAYGPILFQYSLDVLDSIDERMVRITKRNPDKWQANEREEDRFFTDLDTLSFVYDEWDFGQHIVIADQHSPLSFDYLERIVISDPQRDDNHLYEQAFLAIESALHDNDIRVPFVRRDYAYYDRFFEKYDKTFLLTKHYKLGGHRQ